jgi:hypothetical protein
MSDAILGAMERDLPVGMRVEGADERAGYRRSAKNDRLRVLLSFRSRVGARSGGISAAIALFFLITPLVAAPIIEWLGGNAAPCLLSFLILLPMVSLALAPHLLYFLGRAELRVDEQRLSLRHRPVRIDDWQIPTDAIEGLRVLAREPRAGFGDPPDWALVAELADGTEHLVVGELVSEAHARTLESLLRGHTAVGAARAGR